MGNERTLMMNSSQVDRERATSSPSSSMLADRGVQRNILLAPATAAEKNLPPAPTNKGMNGVVRHATSINVHLRGRHDHVQESSPGGPARGGRRCRLSPLPCPP